MKYQDGKLKREHHILPEFEVFLRSVAKLPQVVRLIPWRIARQQKWTSDLRISVSYVTWSGLKCKLKKGATVQELYVICDQADAACVTERIVAFKL